MDIVAFLVGLAVSSVGFGAVVRQRRRAEWPTTKGTITGGDILEVRGFFTGVVRYAYSFGPTSAYRGTEHRLLGRMESVPTRCRADAEDHLARYALGERVDVRYDPMHPTRSGSSRRRRP